MAKRKLTATQRLRQNVKRQIRRMEQSGYRVDTEIKEKLQTAKYQTLKAYQRNKYSKLYDQATAEIDGEIVTGQVAKKEKAKERARIAAQTRKQRRYEKQQWAVESEEDWKRQRRIQDEIERRNAELYQEGQIVYDNIAEMIDDYPTEGSRALKDILKSEMNKYGRDAVIRAMAQAPDDFIANARTIIYYEKDKDKIHSAITDFVHVITGTLPTAEEAKQIGETMDTMTDMGVE